MYNLCRDYDLLEKGDRKTLKSFALRFEDDYEIPADLRKLKAKTNIDYIMKVIREKLAENYKKLLAKEIQHNYMDVLQNLNRVTKEKKETMKELLNASYSDGEKLALKLKEQNKKCDEVRESSQQLQKILKDVEYKSRTRADVICGKLRLKLSQEKQ